MITTADFRRGLRLLLDGQPYALEDVQVPLYISAGERVRVETATGAFVERASGQVRRLRPSG